MASKVAISASSIAILAKLTEAAAYSSASSARCAATFRLTASFLDATLLLIFASRWLWSAWSFSQPEAAAAFPATTFALNSSCLAFAAALEASRVASTFSLVSFSAASTFARCAATFRLTASFLDATLRGIFAFRWLWSAWSFSQPEAAAAFLATTFALNSSCLAFAAALEASRVASTFSLVSFSDASTFFSAFSAWPASSRRLSESFFMILSFISVVLFTVRRTQSAARAFLPFIGCQGPAATPRRTAPAATRAARPRQPPHTAPRRQRCCRHLAALDILVGEAGGAFISLDGTAGPHGGSAVATNGLLHQQV